MAVERFAARRINKNYIVWQHRPSMPTDCITQNTGGTRGGTTAPATFMKTSACASTLIGDHLIRAPRCLGRNRSRGAEGKTFTFGSRTAGHRHRQPRPSLRCRLGLGRFANHRAPAETAMSHRVGQDPDVHYCSLFLLQSLIDSSAHGQ